MRTILAVIVLTLAGCSSVQFVKPGITAQQAQQDRAECQYDAEKAAAPITNPMEQGFREVSFLRQCLASRGYVQK